MSDMHKTDIARCNAVIRMLEAELAAAQAQMNRCPDCKNKFVQPFTCTTCGAQKLYDATLAEAMDQRDKAVFALQGLLEDITDYQNSNNLGGENNHWQVIARAVLQECEK